MISIIQLINDEQSLIEGDVVLKNGQLAWTTQPNNEGELFIGTEDGYVKVAVSVAFSLRLEQLIGELQDVVEIIGDDIELKVEQAKLLLQKIKEARDFILETIETEITNVEARSKTYTETYVDAKTADNIYMNSNKDITITTYINNIRDNLQGQIDNLITDFASLDDNIDERIRVAKKSVDDRIDALNGETLPANDTDEDYSVNDFIRDSISGSNTYTNTRLLEFTKIPLRKDFESELRGNIAQGYEPVRHWKEGKAGDFYFVKELDIRYPGFKGIMWWNPNGGGDGDGDWETEMDQSLIPDGVTLLVGDDEKIKINPNSQIFIDIKNYNDTTNTTTLTQAKAYVDNLLLQNLKLPGFVNFESDLIGMGWDHEGTPKGGVAFEEGNPGDNYYIRELDYTDREIKDLTKRRQGRAWWNPKKPRTDTIDGNWEIVPDKQLFPDSITTKLDGNGQIAVIEDAEYLETIRGSITSVDSKFVTITTNLNTKIDTREAAIRSDAALMKTNLENRMDGLDLATNEKFEGEIDRVETESKTRDGNLNTKIENVDIALRTFATQHITRINGEIAESNGRIDDAEDEIDRVETESKERDTALDNKILALSGENIPGCLDEDTIQDAKDMTINEYTRSLFEEAKEHADEIVLNNLRIPGKIDRESRLRNKDAITGIYYNMHQQTGYTGEPPKHGENYIVEDLDITYPVHGDERKHQGKMWWNPDKKYTGSDIEGKWELVRDEKIFADDDTIITNDTTGLIEVNIEAEYLGNIRSSISDTNTRIDELHGSNLNIDDEDETKTIKEYVDDSIENFDIDLTERFLSFTKVLKRTDLESNFRGDGGTKPFKDGEIGDIYIVKNLDVSHPGFKGIMWWRSGTDLGPNGKGLWEIEKDETLLPDEDELIYKADGTITLNPDSELLQAIYAQITTEVGELKTEIEEEIIEPITTDITTLEGRANDLDEAIERIDETIEELDGNKIKATFELDEDREDAYGKTINEYIESLYQAALDHTNGIILQNLKIPKFIDRESLLRRIDDNTEEYYDLHTTPTFDGDMPEPGDNYIVGHLDITYTDNPYKGLMWWNPDDSYPKTPNIKGRWEAVKDERLFPDGFTTKLDNGRIAVDFSHTYFTELESELEGLHEDVERIDEKLNDIDEDIGEINGRIDGVEEDIETRESTLRGEITEHVSTLEGEIDRVETESKTRDGNLNTKIENVDIALRTFATQQDRKSVV